MAFENRGIVLNLNICGWVDISKGASPSPNAVDSQSKAEVSPAHMSTC